MSVRMNEGGSRVEGVGNGRTVDGGGRGAKTMRLVALFALAASLLAACSGTEGTRGVGPGTAPLDESGIRPYSGSSGDGTDGGLIANPFTNRHVRGARLGVHNNRRLVLSEELNRELETMIEVDEAIVFLSERNAYVALRLNAKAGKPDPQTNIPNGSDMEFGNYSSDDRVSVALKERIAGKVRNRHPEAKNVFVSANPNFVRAMQGFVDRMDRGQPANAMLEEFNETASRVFPTRPGEGEHGAEMRPDALGSTPQTNIGRGRAFRYRTP